MPKPLLITQRRRSKNPQIHPSPPPLLCCVSCRRLSTGRPQRCSSLSPLPRPGGSSSSWARASLPLLRDSRLRSCTRLWTWSTSTGALRTVSTVTTVTASTAPSRTGTEMTVCSRPCLRCSTMPASESLTEQWGDLSGRDCWFGSCGTRWNEEGWDQALGEEEEKRYRKRENSSCSVVPPKMLHIWPINLHLPITFCKQIFKFLHSVHNVQMWFKASALSPCSESKKNHLHQTKSGVGGGDGVDGGLFSHLFTACWSMPPLESKFCNSSYILSIYYSETWIVIWICNYIKNLDILIQKSHFYRLFLALSKVYVNMFLTTNLFAVGDKLILIQINMNLRVKLNLNSISHLKRFKSVD